MSNEERYYAQLNVEGDRMMVASFADINDRDGFEISLGMYRGNLGPVTEEVFRRFAEKFNGMVQE